MSLYTNDDKSLLIFFDFFVKQKSNENKIYMYFILSSYDDRMRVRLYYHHKNINLRFLDTELLLTDYYKFIRKIKLNKLNENK